MLGGTGLVVEGLPLQAELYTSCCILLESDSSDPQWERRVMVNEMTLMEWRDSGTERTLVEPCLVKPHKMLTGCVTWGMVPNVKPFALLSTNSSANWPALLRSLDFLSTNQILRSWEQIL